MIGWHDVLSRIVRFYRTGPDLPALAEPADVRRRYERMRWSAFLGITIGYGLFYTCKLGFSVVKKPILDAGVLDAAQLGHVGSALLFVYAFGKLANGALADRSNIKRFMSTGLLASALINLAVGASSSYGALLCLWMVNGWFQSMGSSPSGVVLSYWFSDRERGTRYGIWSVSHSIGEGLSFLVTSALVAGYGWRWGFFAPGLLCCAGAVALYLALADRPRCYGLPEVAEYKNDHRAPAAASVGAAQLAVLRSPAVWILGLASACMYVARYAVNNWAMLYLQEAKGYSQTGAGATLSAYPITAMLGSATSGLISDRLFGARRNLPALLYGLLEIGALVALYLIPRGHPWLDAAALALFGLALGSLLVFLGGLMAIDLSPKRATGTVMGLIGLLSYLGAAVQDWVSGALIEADKLVADGRTLYRFDRVFHFWIGASVLSALLACSVWRARRRE
jgi:OPA family sugar phosphate sensor protein UhpC-like MFS transporter